MKRRWAGVFLTLFASILPFLTLFTPVAAEANSSNTCIPSSLLGCVNLDVVLNDPDNPNGFPLTGVTVTANRVAPGGGADDSFPLNVDADEARRNIFHSNGTIWGTNDENCDVNPSADRNYFTFTVSGAGVTPVTSPKFNLCYSENNASSTGGLLQRSVTVHWTSGAPATKGGLDGTFSTKDTAGNQRACGGGSNVLLIGSSTTQYSISDNGNNTSGFSSGGFTIDPGTYNVTINCTVSSSGTAGVINVTGVVIKANEITHLGNLVCDANVDNCGSNGQQPPLPTGTGGGGTTNDTPPDCDAGPGFTWIICGAIHLVVSAVDTIRDSVIVPFLKEPAFDKNDPQFAPAYAIWSSFRNVASVFFILVFFFIVIGTAFGFDNYTIKKVLPHLIAGAILVPFSWYFCALVIDIGNVLGQGVVAIVNAANISTNIDLTSSFDKIFFGGAAVVGGIILVGAAATVGLGAAITLLLAFATVFLTLILRKILIMLCVVVSPFALLAWVLPNTEKWFREWYRNFFKLVMMYPIIMMLFEAGRIFSATAGATHSAPCTAAGCLQNLIIPIFQITGLVLPLFLVPLAFKWAGKGLALASNAAGKVTGAADKKYGKNSEWAKDRAADAKRNSVNRAKIAEADAKNATGFRKAALEKKAAMNWRRAGLHGKSDTKKLERSAAYGKAMEEKGTVAAEARQGREGDPEDPRQRLASATQSILNKKSLERGQRQGVLDAYNASGAPSARTLQTQARNATRDSGIEQYGSAAGENARNLLNDRNAIHDPANHVSNAQKFAAANIAGAAKLGDKLGDAKGINAGTAAYEDQLAQQIAGAGVAVTAAHRAAARTMRMNDNTGAKADDTAKSHVTTNQTANTKITGEAELDTLEQGKHAAGTVTLDQARRMRLQNLAASTDTQVRESLGTQEGDITARNLVTSTAGRETMKAISDAGTLKARDTAAAGRADRSQRVALQNTSEGYRTTSEVLATANTKAGEHMAEGIGADKQLLEQHHADEALASAQGNPNLSPSLNNWVRSGAEKSKASLSAQSTQRMANVSALATGNASTALEETTAGLQAAERNAVIKGQAVKGQAETLNTNLTAEAARLAGGGPITAAHINQAANNIRARSLGSAANPVGAGAVARAQAATDLTNQIGTDVGGGRNLQAEIDTEAATLAGGGAVTAAHINQARANVQDRHLKSVQQNSEHAGATKNREDRSLAAGTASGLTAQINEEALALAGGGAVTPAHIDQARANVQARNLSAAGAAAFDKGAADVRRANETKIGLEQDIDDAIATEAATLAGGAAITGAHLAQARSNVLQRRSDTLGKNVRTQASVKAREEADSNIRGAAAIDQVIGNEAQRLIDTGAATGLSAAQITDQARRNVVAAAGTATGLATADKISKDLRGNVGIANDLEAEVDARVAQTHPGATGPALTAARDQARANIRAERVANTGDEAEAAAGRTAAKQRGKSKKVANDIQAKITDQVGPGANAGTRAAAAKNIRDKELSDIAEDSGIKSARSFREEAEGAAGSVNLQDELIDKAMRDDPTLSRGAATQKVFAETQADAGKAARITGEQAATQAISKSRGVIRSADAANKRVQDKATEKLVDQEAELGASSYYADRAVHTAQRKAAHDKASEKYIPDAVKRAEAAVQKRYGRNLTADERAKAIANAEKRIDKNPGVILSPEEKASIDTQQRAAIKADIMQKSTTTSTMNTDEARSQVRLDALKAGQELTERQQNQQYGSQAALAEAFSEPITANPNDPGRPELSKRIDTYRQSESKRIVGEEATVNAYQKVTEERRNRGVVEQGYSSKVSETNTAEYDRLLDNLASQASVAKKIPVKMKNADGSFAKDSAGNEIVREVSIKDADLSEENIAALIDVVKTGDDAERIAALDKLTGSGASQQSFDMVRRELTGRNPITGEPNLFGGDIHNTVDPKYKAIWDKGTRHSKQLDADKPPIAAFTSLAASDLVPLGDGGMRRATEFYVQWKKDIDANLASRDKTRIEQGTKDLASYEENLQQFNQAVRDAATNRQIGGRVDPRAWNTVAKYDKATNPEGIFDSNVVAASSGYRAAPDATVAPTISNAIFEYISPAKGTAPSGTPHDVDYANEIYERIVAGRSVDASGNTVPSAIETNIQNALMEGRALTPADLGGPKTPTPTPTPGTAAPVTIPRGLQEFIWQKASTGTAKEATKNLDLVAGVYNAYRTDAAYRALLENAFKEKLPLPPPPEPPTP